MGPSVSGALDVSALGLGERLRLAEILAETPLIAGGQHHQARVFPPQRVLAMHPLPLATAEQAFPKDRSRRIHCPALVQLILT